MSACIIGWHHLKFGKHENANIEELITDAVAGALTHAEVEPKDIDQIFLGTFNSGFVHQDFPSSLVLQANDELRFTPATRVENACATGSAAIYQGLNALAARQARRVLVVGVEKMSERAPDEVGAILARASYVREDDVANPSFVDVFARIAERYFQQYGDKSDALARIAAKNHKNGCGNPFAHMRKDLGYEFCRRVSDKNPVVAGPLKRTDCSLVSDGAAALVLADMDTALSAPRAVYFRAARQVNDFLPLSKRSIIDFDGPARAWRDALDLSGLTLNDLSLVETHDCFTIAELIEYEAMGLTEKGQGERAILEGWTEMNGRLPINPSGGLKAKGHPVGATGVSMHIMGAMQTTASAPSGIQVEGANLAGVFNMGGAAVANYVSVLEPLR